MGVKFHSADSLFFEETVQIQPGEITYLVSFRDYWKEENSNTAFPLAKTEKKCFFLQK